MRLPAYPNYKSNGVEWFGRISEALEVAGVDINPRTGDHGPFAGCDRMSKNLRTSRLRGYDYSRAGIYFVTICAQNRRCIFGDILNGAMRLNGTEKIVAGEWGKSAKIRDEIELDEWVVMPNHFHGIVWIQNGDIEPMRDYRRGDRPVAPTTGPRPRSLGALIAGFKSAVTKQINQIRQTPGGGLWQRNYWEHIIRNEEEFNRIREYIVNNPARWDLDQENPHATASRRGDRLVALI